MRKLPEGIQKRLNSGGDICPPDILLFFCHNEEYDPAVTMSNCGILPNYAIKQDDMIRSLDPNFSITAWGHNAEFYTADPSHESFGKGSVWERFLSTGGKLVCMNFDCGSTFVHYVEKYRNVDYRFNKSFNGVIVTKDGRRYRDYAVHFVHDENDTKTVFGKLDAKCREAGICKVSNLGKGTLMAIDLKDYYDLINKGLDSDPDFLRDRG